MTTRPLRYTTVLALLGALLLLGMTAFGEETAMPQPRIGDKGSVYDPTRDDPRFPLMQEFAKAGVEGGIPAREETPVKATVKPGEDIQAAIDAVAKDAPGVVLLAAGEYRIPATLELRSGVILRGADREKTVILYGPEEAPLACAVRMKQVERAALEDVTLRNLAVSAMDPAGYLGNYYLGKSPWKLAGWNWATIEIIGATNCWVQGIRNLLSVSRPIRIFDNAKHITLRDSLTDGAFLKGGGGNGYYEIVGAQYVLVYNETIRNIRHICLDGACDYTVFIHCRAGVDFNWHCIPPMRNTLVESCVSYLRPGHWWKTLSHFRDPVGKDNYVYKHEAWCKGEETFDGQVPCTPNLYLKAQEVTKYAGDPPAHGTLYPVTGVHVEDPDEAAARTAFAALKPLLQGNDAAITDEALRGKLQALVTAYPKTAAGVFAQQLLDWPGQTKHDAAMRAYRPDLLRM